MKVKIDTDITVINKGIWDAQTNIDEDTVF